MFIENIDIDHLETRLDAGFYNPEYLKLSDRLKELKARPLKDISSKIACGPFGGNAIADDIYEEDGLFFIRPINITSNTFDDSSLVKVPESTLLENGLKVYEGENLYFGRVGVPCVALISGKTSISPNIIIAELKNISADSYYLSCFLSSKYGLSQLQRQLKEVAQPTTSTDAVKDLLVYEPQTSVQTYIGNKARQATQLTKWLKRLNKTPIIVEALIKGLLSEQEIIKIAEGMELDDLDTDKLLFDKFCNAETTNGNNILFRELVKGAVPGSVDTERELFHINKISATEIEDFLSAQTYRPAITKAFKTIKAKSYECLQDLCIEPIKQGATPKFSDIGKDCLKSKQTREFYLDDIGYETVDPNDLDNSSITRLKDGDLVITRQGAGTVGRASIFLGSDELYITDSLFLIRVNPEKADSAFIAAYLRSYTGQRLIEKGVYGSTGQLNLGNGHLKALPILKLNMKVQNYFGDKIRLANEVKVYEKALNRASKLLVELIIEGQITELEIVEAQQALEAGDNSKDRAILSKLTDKGYLADDGKPLFADLDKLYELLDEAKLAVDASEESD